MNVCVCVVGSHNEQTMRSVSYSNGAVNAGKNICFLFGDVPDLATNQKVCKLVHSKKSVLL